MVGRACAMPAQRHGAARSGADIAKNGYATQRSKMPMYRVLSGHRR
jgi:hypothetical protein